MFLLCVILWTQVFGHRPNSNQTRICVLGFSANRVWLVDLDLLTAGGWPVGSRFNCWLIPDRTQLKIHSYCDDWSPVVGRWGQWSEGGRPVPVIYLVMPSKYTSSVQTELRGHVLTLSEHLETREFTSMDHIQVAKHPYATRKNSR